MGTLNAEQKQKLIERLLDKMEDLINTTDLTDGAEVLYNHYQEWVDYLIKNGEEPLTTEEVAVSPTLSFSPQKYGKAPIYRPPVKLDDWEMGTVTCEAPYNDPPSQYAPDQ